MRHATILLAVLVRERATIEALALRHSADPTPDRAALDRAYADAMRELARRFPAGLGAGRRDPGLVPVLSPAPNT